MTIVIFALVIFISSILISSKFGLLVTVITITSFVMLGVHEYNNPYILSWRMDAINNTDFVIYSLLLMFVALLSWLSNREIENSLKKAKILENNLITERNSLEVRVEERTKELKESQLNRINELEKVAEFGRLSQGMFHDLLSPLSSLVLHMEKIKNMPYEEILKSHHSLTKIIENSHRMNENINRLRCSIKDSIPPKICVIKNEIKNSTDILRFKAREYNVTINIIGSEDGQWFGDSMKLNQIFNNLISNAIDACSVVNDRDRMVDILISGNNEFSQISIKDNGVGIDETNLGKIFDPFFTTKSPERGTGTGLVTVQKVLKEINGRILINSQKNIGSEFIVTIPLKK